MMTKGESMNGLKEKGFIVVLVVCLTLVFWKPVFCENCPNLVEIGITLATGRFMTLPSPATVSRCKAVFPHH